MENNKNLNVNNEGDFISVQDILDSLRRGKWIILSTFLVFMMSSSIYYYFEPNIYSSVAKLMYDSGAATVSIFGSDMSYSKSRALGNELEILKTREFSEKVESAMRDSLTLNKDLVKYPLFNILKNSNRPNSILGQIMSNKNVSSPRSLDIITVTFNSYDPVECSIIANIIAQVYITNNVKNNRVAQVAVKNFIKSQLDLKNAELKSAENSLQSYMVESKVVTMSAESEDAVKKLAELESKISESNIQIGILEQQIKASDDELKRIEPNLAEQTLDNVIDEFTKQLQQQIATAEVEREVTIAKENLNDPAIKAIVQRADRVINNYKKQLDDRITSAYQKGIPYNALERTKSLASVKITSQSQIVIERYKIEEYKDASKEYEKKYATIPAKNIEFARLTRAKISAEELYLALEKRYQESLIAEMQVVSNIKVIDSAIPSYFPVEPKRAQMITIFSVIGVLFGFGISLAIKKLDNRIHKIDDLEKIGLKILGQIPLEDSVPINGKILNQIPEIVQELIRQIAINITFILNFKKSTSAKLILTTSTVPQEGKTFSAINLANSLTDMGNKVLLIDGDLRRPTIDKNLGLSKAPGLTEFVATGNNVIQKIPTTHGNTFDVITSGTIPISPIPIISSYEFQKILQDFKKEYNVIILDTPPSLSVGDVQIYAEYADGIIYVVAAEIANKKEIIRQYTMLYEKFPDKLMGTILNKIRPDQMGAKGHYYYYQSKND